MAQQDAGLQRSIRRKPFNASRFKVERKEQGYKSRRDESEAMERSMGRRKYASVDTMDMGNRRMAHGGKTKTQAVRDIEKAKKKLIGQ